MAYNEKLANMTRELIALTHKKVEELEEHYSNVKRMLDKKLTKDNLQKVLFNEENLDNSLEVGSTEVNTTIDMERREIFWDFHNKFKTTIYKIKNMSEPSSVDHTAGVFDPLYLTKHKLGTEKEFFEQIGTSRKFHIFFRAYPRCS